LFLIHHRLARFWPGMFGGARTCLVALPSIYAIVLLLGPWVIDPLKIYGGGIVRRSDQILPGYSTIDPNVAYNTYALGSAAAKQLIALQLPLWNHLEGFGQPLLGETQSAALFPLTLLLLFPAGQVIAHAILQIIGGLGMFSLGRNLRFGVKTSFVIALAFEFSSLFVWLKNAMINPIPFLVWLLVYTLRIVRSDPDRFSRIDIVGLGLTAGFAVLGGFPETVLIFSFFLLAWVAFYFFSGSATWPAAIALSKKLVIATLIAFCISAPALVALGVFAPDAYFGSHTDGGVRDAYLSSQALSKYIFPYISGPIFGYPVSDEIGSIGGYTGVTLLVLAIAGALSPQRLAERVFWGLAVAICLAISHGVRPIHGLAMEIPLLNLTAFYRQANAVWLIAMFLLAAHVLEIWPKIGKSRAIVTAGVTVLIVALPLIGNQRWLSELAAVPGVRPWMLGSLVAGSLPAIVLMFAWVCNRRHVVQAMLVAESILLFLIPTFSRPRHAVVDRDLIEFLQQNLNQSRTVNYDHNVIQPNLGTYLSIAQLNFDDLPVPSRTTEYIRSKLDPFFPNTYLYLPDYPMDDRHQERSDYMIEHAADYGNAGVKYILAPHDGLGRKSSVVPAGKVAHAIHVGEKVSFHVSLTPMSPLTGTLGLRLANYFGTTDGEVEITTCRLSEACETQRVPAQSIQDNAFFAVKRNIRIEAPTEYQITLGKVSGHVPLAIWLYPKKIQSSAGQIDIRDLNGVGAAEAGLIPEVVFSVESLPNLRLVHSSFGGDIYEIATVRPYLSGPNCSVATVSFDKAAALCSAPSKLTRLEIWQTGWEAVVNGRPTAVDRDEPFQQIAVPAGELVISFDYNPWGLRYIGELSILAMLGFAALFLSDCWRQEGTIDGRR
jgi:hypothetical protein